MRSVDIGRIAALFLACAAPAAVAQAGSPARAVQLAQQDYGDDTGAGGGGDVSAIIVRLGRLEEQVRNLTGQVEQLQFQNKKLIDDLRKVQADTDFRFQDLQRGSNAPAPPRAAAPPARRGDASEEMTTPAGAAPAGTATAAQGTGETTRPARVASAGDAFDPAANPNAPGAPKPLGTTAPSQPLSSRAPRDSAADDSRAPLDLMRGRQTASASPDAGAPTVIPAPSAARDTGTVASLVPGGTREEYDADLGLYRQGQYENAATSFAAFADKYPKDRLVPDAVYFAGESYARLGRHREAAEQFLKVSTDYGKSARAPDALLKLGISLGALGAREQACATYQEVTRRYPSASPDVRAGVDRELKRARCTGNG